MAKKPLSQRITWNADGSVNVEDCDGTVVTTMPPCPCDNPDPNDGGGIPTPSNVPACDMANMLVDILGVWTNRLLEITADAVDPQQPAPGVVLIGYSEAAFIFLNEFHLDLTMIPSIVSYLSFWYEGLQGIDVGSWQGDTEAPVLVCAAYKSIVMNGNIFNRNAFATAVLAGTPAGSLTSDGLAVLSNLINAMYLSAWNYALNIIGHSITPYPHTWDINCDDCDVTPPSTEGNLCDCTDEPTDCRLFTPPDGRVTGWFEIGHFVVGGDAYWHTNQGTKLRLVLEAGRCISKVRVRGYYSNTDSGSIRSNHTRLYLDGLLASDFETQPIAVYHPVACDDVSDIGWTIFDYTAQPRIASVVEVEGNHPEMYIVQVSIETCDISNQA